MARGVSVLKYFVTGWEEQARRYQRGTVAWERFQATRAIVEDGSDVERRSLYAAAQFFVGQAMPGANGFEPFPAMVQFSGERCDVLGRCQLHGKPCYFDATVRRQVEELVLLRLRVKYETWHSEEMRDAVRDKTFRGAPEVVSRTASDVWEEVDRLQSELVDADAFRSAQSSTQATEK
jgi:hypothetical protein